MTDLNIPNLKKKSDKYIFKKKQSLKRKTKGRLIAESSLMLILSFLLVYINYLIPNKKLLLQNLPITFSNSFSLIAELLTNIFELFLLIYIFISFFTALILMIGSFYRLFRVSIRRSRQIIYK